jgi:RecA-family ATPase
MVANGSVTVLSHPSLQGINSGSGISGSTAWHGAFRFRQYLTSPKPADGEQPENDLRQLEFKKNQYGPTGEAIALKYQRGLFLPLPGISSLDKVARQAKVDDIFLKLLKQFDAQGRNVSDKPTAPNYAPTMFAKETAATSDRIKKPDLDAGMRRLFESNRICVVEYGRASRRASKLALK